MLALALVLAAVPGFAQVTTGSISGTVVDESGAVIPGASVTAVHEPTGTRYAATTERDGHFQIINVRVGGPYVVTVSLQGFKDQQQKDLTVRLGEDRALSFKLSVQALTEAVEVTAEVGIINPSHTGTTDNVSPLALQTLPTVARSLADFARVSPYFAPGGNGDGTGADVLSVAGRSNRYNNIQIDGAQNNDLFGLASNSGNPGGTTETQPISIDAIQELQLTVAPYDVRQGGFSAGGINAVTKSGTNAFHGTAYYFFRDEALVGKGPSDTKIGTFDEKQFGGSVGGPIKKDKIFFFANVDWTRKHTPVGYSIGGATGTQFGHDAEAAQFESILQNKYGYDPGSSDEFVRGTESNKVFARLDFNLGNNHRLTIRDNFTKPTNDIGFPSSRLFLYPDNYYQFHSKTNSIVAQLNSTFGGGKANEARVTYQTIRDRRDGPTEFPQVLVDLQVSGQLRAGREEFSTANELDQDIMEITDDFTLAKGSHLITIGTHNEFFKFRNLFIRDAFGAYRFSSMANFAAGLAQSYDYSFSVTGDPLQAAKFSVYQFGFYAGDLWRVSPRFTLNYGVRVDLPHFPDTPTANPAAVANFGYATDVTPAPKMWSPRAGFNWDIKGDGKQQVRGGVGMFAGRPPYVWLSNQYGNTGIEFQRIGASFNANNKIPFVADPNNQPKVVVGASAGSFRNEIDVVDPNFKYPQVLRTNLGYDRGLGWQGIMLTAEFLYTKTLKDIDYQNLNLVQTGTRPDGRPVFSRQNANFSDVILLLNTDQGSSWTSVIKLERPFRNNWYASASWLYGEAKAVNDGGSDQAASNWGNQYVPGDPNHAPLSISRFDPGHRITAAFSYDWKVGKKGFDVTTSLYYNGQSGRPYSLNINGDWNGDGRTSNDLIYVPANASEVIVKNGTWDQLNAFIEGDKGMSENRGKVMPRNSSRSPWTDQVDFRLAVGIPVQGQKKLEITADVLNFLNMFNKDWGVVDFATFNDLNPIRVSQDTATGKMVYDIATLTAPGYVKFDRDNLRSRWQAQLGARFRF